MPEQNKQLNAEPSATNRPRQEQPWKVLLCLIGVALLLNVSVAATALNYFVPMAANGRQRLADRMQWYVHSGQLQADARSLAAAFDYIMSTDRDVPATTTNLAVLPVAEEAAPSAPKS